MDPTPTQRTITGHHFDRDEAAGPDKYRCRTCGGRVTYPPAIEAEGSAVCDFSGPDRCEAPR